MFCHENFLIIEKSSFPLLCSITHATRRRDQNFLRQLIVIMYTLCHPEPHTSKRQISYQMLISIFLPLLFFFFQRTGTNTSLFRVPFYSVLFLYSYFVLFRISPTLSRSFFICYIAICTHDSKIAKQTNFLVLARPRRMVTGTCVIRPRYSYCHHTIKLSLKSKNPPASGSLGPSESGYSTYQRFDSFSQSVLS